MNRLHDREWGSMARLAAVEAGRLFHLSHSPTITEFFRSTYLVERPLRDTTRRQMESTLRLLVQHLGRDPRLAELRPELLNGFLMAQECTASPRTVRKRRGELLAIWRYAAGLQVAAEPKRIRMIRVPSAIPRAWSLAELAAIYRAADALEGAYPQKILRCDWWGAFIRTLYDTGLRRSDVLALRTEDIERSQPCIHVVQRKTRWRISCPIRTDTLARIDRVTRADRPFPWPFVEYTLLAHFRTLLIAAGLVANHGGHGGLHQLRRTSATHVEAVSPGAAAAHLGHLTPGLAYKHYVDPRIAHAHRILPPEVG